MKISSRTLLVLALLSPFLIGGVVETGRVITVWGKVTNAARWGERYAVTGEYDAANCSAGCDAEDDFAAMDAARLLFIHQKAQQILGDLPATITVCAERDGFVFDEEKNQCRPYEQAGVPGEKVQVSVSYEYTLGSAFGTGAAVFPLRATSSGIVEQFRTSRIMGIGSQIGDVPADAPAAPAAPAAAPAASAPSAPAAVPALSMLDGGERMVVINGEYQLVVEDVSQALAQVQQFAVEAKGYVVESHIWTERDLTHAKVVVRVPDADFYPLADRIKGVAATLVEEAITGKDVTEEYTDLQGQLRGAQATYDRILGILEDTKTVREALDVNAKLAEVQKQIEQLQGKIVYLENQDRMATLTVSLEPNIPPVIETVAVAGWQPLETVRRAAGFLAGIGRFVVDMLIWALIVGGPFALVVAIGIWITKRLSRKTTPST